MSERYMIVCEQTLIATGSGMAPLVDDWISVNKDLYHVIEREWSFTKDDPSALVACVGKLKIRVTLWKD